MNKLGIVIFVTGVALFLVHELRALGPAGKIVVGYVTGVTLLGAGAFFGRRERYRILARAGIGGGWALIFFSAYAMYHVPASHVLSSQGADLLLMLTVAALMVVHTLRYQSQVVTGLAFLLAFSTVTISHVSVYSLSAGAVLAVALVAIVVRMRWFELEILGIVASYVNHYVWLRPIIGPMHGHHRPFPGFTASAALLILYWAAFRTSYLVRRVQSPRQESVSGGAALLNAFLLLGLMKYQSVHPEWAFWFLLFLGAAELALGQSPIARRRRAAFVILSTLGVALLVAAFPFRDSGEHLSVLWLMEAEAFFLAGVLVGESLFRRLGMLASFVAAGQMIAVDAARVLGERWDGARVVNDLRLGIVFALGALILWTNAHWIPRRWPGQESNRFFSVLCSRTSHVAALLAVTGARILQGEVAAVVSTHAHQHSTAQELGGSPLLEESPWNFSPAMLLVSERKLSTPDMNLTSSALPLGPRRSQNSALPAIVESLPTFTPCGREKSWRASFSVASTVAWFPTRASNREYISSR